MFWPLALAVLASSPPPPPPLLAVHPLIIEGREDDQLAPLLPLAMAKLALSTAPADEVRAVLAADPAQSCVGRDLCLVALARATRSRFAMLVTLSESQKRPLLSARVVRLDGFVARNIEQRAIGVEGARVALDELLRDLELPALATETGPALQGVPESPSEKTSGMRLAAYGCGAATAGLGAAALGFALSARADARLLATHLDAQGRWPLGDSEAARLSASVDQKSSLSTGFAVGAGAALVAGAALFVLAPADGPAATVLVTPTGALLAVSLRLP